MTPSTEITLLPGDRYAVPSKSTTHHIVIAGPDRGPEGYSDYAATAICGASFAGRRYPTSVMDAAYPAWRIMVCSPCARRRPRSKEQAST